MRFLKKVEEKIRRYAEVEKLLQDPTVTQDQSRLRELGKELRLLEKVVFLYREFLKNEEELGHTQEMLAGDKGHSSEFLEMAEQELPALEAKRDELAKKI